MFNFVNMKEQTLQDYLQDSIYHDLKYSSITGRYLPIKKLENYISQSEFDFIEIGRSVDYHQLVAGILAPKCFTIFGGLSSESGREKMFCSPILKPHGLPTPTKDVLFLSAHPELLECMSVVITEDFSFSQARCITNIAPIVFHDPLETESVPERDQCQSPLALV